MGSGLYGAWEPSRDATVISGRVQSIASMIGGNAFLAAAEANRPLYVNGLGTPGAKATVRIDGNARYLDAAIALAAANRCSLAVIYRVTGLTTDRIVLEASNGGADPSYIYYLAGTANYIYRAAFTSGAVTVTATTPPRDSKAWHLHCIHPYAAGAAIEVDGVATSPNFASTQTLRQISRARLGHSGSSGSGEVAGIYFFEASLTNTAALETYAAARFEGDVGTEQAHLILIGQSNAANQNWPDGAPGATGWQGTRVALGATGFVNGYWKPGGAAPGNGTLYTQLVAAVNAAPVGLPPTIWVVLGETDANTEAGANAFETEFLAMVDQLVLDTGRTDIRWIMQRFHAEFINNPGDWADVVDAAIVNIAAALGANCIGTIDPNVVCSEPDPFTDGIHYTTTAYTELQAAAVAIAVAA